MTELDAFRRAKDDFFLNDDQSPLTAAQKRGFAGLHYFPEDPALRFEVLVAASGKPESVELQTSTGDIQRYSRVGRLRFDVDGDTAELTLFQGPSGPFLPFVDSLAGTETYPAGRYLEPEPLPGGRYLVDFNFSYNPYCAYNAQWSCPLTPVENRLKLPIRAGERLFAETH